MPLSGFTFAQPWQLQQRFDFPTAGAMTLSPTRLGPETELESVWATQVPRYLSHRLHSLLRVKSASALSSDNDKCSYVSRAVALTRMSCEQAGV